MFGSGTISCFSNGINSLINECLMTIASFHKQTVKSNARGATLGGDNK